MASTRPRTQHETPVLYATVAVVLGIVGFFSGLIVPQAGLVGHSVFTIVFGAVAVLAGIRTLVVTGRRSGARVSAWIGIVGGGLGLGMLFYQLLVIATHYAIPAPFWAPFAH